MVQPGTVTAISGTLSLLRPVLEHTWHTAVGSSTFCLPLGRSEVVQDGILVSASLVTSRAILCLLVPHAIIGETRDGVNEKASRTRLL